MAAKVERVGDEVRPDEIDTYGRFRQIEDKSRKLRTVLGAWERQQIEERMLRRTYAKYSLIALSVQIIIINGAFFCIGLGLLTIDRWVATTFIMAVFSEIAGMALIAIKYLFPKVGSEVLDLIEKL